MCINTFQLYDFVILYRNLNIAPRAKLARAGAMYDTTMNMQHPNMKQIMQYINIYIYI